MHTFANTINTHEGGTHEEGFRAALTTLVNKFARGVEPAQGEGGPNLSGDDIREGLTAIISIKLGEPQFEGQTKTKLGNTEAKGFVQRVVNDQLGAWFEQNPAEGKDIVRKAQAAAAGPDRRPQGARPRPQPQGPARRRRPARQAVATASRPTPRSARSSSSRATRPAARPRRAATRGSRRSCRSAARSSTSRRPASTRCCGNTEVQALISALGTGIHEEFDIDKLRYHKIVLMADADVDGQHIRTLLLTLLFRFMKPLDRGTATSTWRSRRCTG